MTGCRLVRTVRSESRISICTIVDATRKSLSPDERGRRPEARMTLFKKFFFGDHAAAGL